MKISQKPTGHILVRAQCQSEWDNCDFALIFCDENWNELMKKRLEAAVSFFEDYSFDHFSYRDDSVEFYTSNGDEIEKLFTEMGDRNCAFVTLDAGEVESFQRPESRLECYSLHLYRDGSGLYKANAKNTGDEFFTTEFSIPQIAVPMLPTCGSMDRRTESHFRLLGCLIHNSVVAFLKQEQENSMHEK